MVPEGRGKGRDSEVGIVESGYLVLEQVATNPKNNEARLARDTFWSLLPRHIHVFPGSKHQGESSLGDTEDKSKRKIVANARRRDVMEHIWLIRVANGTDREHTLTFAG